MLLRPVAWTLLVATAVTTASVAAALAQPPGQLDPAPDGADRPAATEVAKGEAGGQEAEKETSELPRLDGERLPAGSDRPAGDPAAKEKIERALRGEPVTVPGGDPVLEDVLKIIRGQGSVLDGSVLDADTEAGAEADTGRDGAGRAVRSGRGVNQSAAAAERRQARAAEMLLRTSRLLERLQPVDARRRELISSMRAEAARVLSP